MPPSDVGLHVRHSPLHQAASTTDTHARQIQFIYQVTEQRRPSWSCYNPCDHQGELKGKALRSALRRGGGRSTVKRSVQRRFHFLPHYHKRRMTPPLCESDFNTGADLSPEEPQSGLSSETGPLISYQTQTTVLVSNNPSLKVQTLTAGLEGQG